jgi:hypothetical protein
MTTFKVLLVLLNVSCLFKRKGEWHQRKIIGYFVREGILLAQLWELMCNPMTRIILKKFEVGYKKPCEWFYLLRIVDNRYESNEVFEKSS